MNNLKPLNWSENDYIGIRTHTAESPLHTYSIRIDYFEGGYLINYHERMTGESGCTHAKTLEDAKYWCEFTHYASKMQPYVKTDSITEIRNWFKSAKPEPTNKDICTQIGCHYEEVSEMAIPLMDYEIRNSAEHVADGYKNGLVEINAVVEYLSYSNKIELLDALCDQIVTATGVAYMMGFDIEGALKEVIRSNNSKMLDGKFEFDENGKIMKAEGYSKPDLTPFIKDSDYE